MPLSFSSRQRQVRKPLHQSLLLIATFRTVVVMCSAWLALPAQLVDATPSNQYQVAAPTETRTPPSTERISLTKECGWKDGDRGGLAEWEQTHGKKKAKWVLTSTVLLTEGLSSQATPNRAYARLEGINTVVTVIPCIDCRVFQRLWSFVHKVKRSWTESHWSG